LLALTANDSTRNPTFIPTVNSTANPAVVLTSDPIMKSLQCLSSNLFGFLIYICENIGFVFGWCYYFMFVCFYHGIHWILRCVIEYLSASRRQKRKYFEVSCEDGVEPKEKEIDLKKFDFIYWKNAIAICNLNICFIWSKLLLSTSADRETAMKIPMQRRLHLFPTLLCLDDNLQLIDLTICASESAHDKLKKNDLFLEDDTCKDAHARLKDDGRSTLSLNDNVMSNKDEEEIIFLNEIICQSSRIADTRANMFLKKYFCDKVVGIKKVFCYLYIWIASLIVFMCKYALITESNASHNWFCKCYAFLILVVICDAVHRIMTAHVFDASSFNAMRRKYINLKLDIGNLSLIQEVIFYFWQESIWEKAMRLTLSC